MKLASLEIQAAIEAIFPTVLGIYNIPLQKKALEVTVVHAYLQEH